MTRSRATPPIADSMSVADCAEVFSRLRAANPRPRTELRYRTPFELLVAVILSAQATDVSVNQATRTLFRAARTPRGMLRIGEQGIHAHIRHIGLANGKARNIVGTCERLLREHRGEVPCDRAALEALPGVGRKTANVVLNTAFGMATIAVDTHIFRVANRTRMAPGRTPLEVERGLLANVPEAYLRDAHHWLILHGRYVCVARRPRCHECPIADLCPRHGVECPGAR